jgi:type I restriction enzyme M protein
VLNPTAADEVIDPACGSGGFLVEATRYAMANGNPPPKCLGIDFGAKAVKVAALLSKAYPKARISISKANSLDGRGYCDKTPLEWRDFLTDNVGSKTQKAKKWGDWNKLGCTVLVTNPPFAGEIDDPDIVAAYECSRRMGAKKSLSREHLFLERSVEMLRPGGRLAIVLPQGILANTSAGFLRQWLAERCRIIGVIGLHPFAFLPHTSVKTSILFIEKLPDGQPPPQGYKVFFATSSVPGKDSSGRSTGSTDYPDLSKAFRRFLKSEGKQWACCQGSDAPNPENLATGIVPIEEVLDAGRLDAEFFDPKKRSVSSALLQNSEHLLGELVEPRLARFKRRHFGEIKYFDISCVDQKTGLAFPECMPAEEAPSRAAYVVAAGDILVSTVRPERNVIGFIPKGFEGTGIASNGFCVLRPKTVAPELLFAYCKTRAFREMLSRKATASMYPAVTDKDVLSVPFPQPPSEVSEKVAALVDSAFRLIREANRQMAEAVELMNEHLGQHEEKAPQKE